MTTPFFYILYLFFFLLLFVDIRVSRLGFTFSETTNESGRETQPCEFNARIKIVALTLKQQMRN